MVLYFLGGVSCLAQPPENSPYGVHSHVTRSDEHPFLSEEIARMEEANIRWLRTGFVWAALERREGEWDFQRTDEVVEQCETAGIRIMGLLHGSPRWAKPTIEHLDAWRKFVRTTVTRYKGRVPAWQVWNEPNLKSFWENPNPEHYAKLLRTSYEEIKKSDPEAMVVWGATSQLDWRFLKTALSQAEGMFDVMAIHPYGYGDPRAPEAYIPDAIEELRGLLAQYDVGDRPIWFTEWGWPSHHGRRGMSDRQQGQYIARAYILALHAGLQRGFWYEFQERRETDEENEDAFGILEYDLKPKPAYQAYRTLIDVRPAGSTVVANRWKTGLVYHPAWKRPDGTTVHAIWDVWTRWAKPRNKTVEFEGVLQEVRDYLGEKVEIEVTENGQAILPLEWGSPLYVIGPREVIVR
jgi:beta-xylosidase